MDLSELLKHAVEHGASDLHLTAADNASRSEPALFGKLTVVTRGL